LEQRIIGVLSMMAVTVPLLAGVAMPLYAADNEVKFAVPGEGAMNGQALSLGVGKSVVIDLPREIKDVLVGDPKIANAVVRSSQRAYIIGATVGQTNIVFFDASGQQIVAYDIAVKRDLNGIRASLKQVIPDAEIQVEGLGDGVVLTGSVANAVESQQAQDLAERVSGSGKVVNSLQIRGRDQVMLKVTVAEVARSVIKQLGIDLSASLNYGTAVLNFNNSTPFSANGGSVVDANSLITSFGSKPTVQATLRAMERAGVIRTLAEPNLTAISGESARFLAGGEFPVPGNYSCDPQTHVCTTSVTYKQFGVGLSFTPVVMSEGRISLKVATEVSELSQENALTLSQGNSGSMTIPSVKTRRVETTLEIPSGGSMAMAGLIQQQTKQAINGMPGMMQLPVLGTLFRSRDYVNNDTELMVIVTPYIVHAVAQKQLARPDDGFAAQADPQAQLLGSINRIYGAPGRNDPPQNYHGAYGFITD